MNKTVLEFKSDVAFEEGMAVTIVDDRVRFSITQDQPLDDRNEAFENDFTATSEQVSELRNWLCTRATDAVRRHFAIILDEARRKGSDE